MEFPLLLLGTVAYTRLGNKCPKSMVAALRFLQ
jgi:hypothetical protein